MPLYKALKKAPESRLVHLRFLDETMLVKTIEDAHIFISRLFKSGITHFSLAVLEVMLPQALSQWPDVDLAIIEKLIASMPQGDCLGSHLPYYQQWIEINGQWLRLDSAGIVWTQQQTPARAELLARLPAEKLAFEEQRKKFESSKSNYTKLEQSCLSLQSTVSRLEQDSKRQQSKLVELKSRHRACCESSSQVQARLKEVEPRLHNSQEKLDNLLKEKQQIQEQLLSIECSRKSTESECLPKKEELHRLEQLLRQNEMAHRQYRESHEKYGRQLAQAQTQIEIHSQQHQTLYLKLQSLELREQKQQARVQEISASLDQLRPKIDESMQEVSRLKLANEQLSKQVQANQLQVTQLKKQMQDLQQQTRELELRLQELQGRKDKTLWQRKRYEAEMQERFALAVDLLDLPYVELEQAGQQIRKLKAQLEEMGEVNFAAIRELQDIESRQSLLEVQMKDVQESQLEAMRAIAKLDERCKRQFKETFQQVAQAFERNFTLLFEGGQARLSLSAGSDEDSSGVEVFACPPGKQLKSMTLMSGGEKCLTSMAFMMALFEVRPAPFCLLDEIDAPLDDANVDRFLKLLRHYSTKTQVFIITHNKKTMAAAQTLIGVSMPQRGVSKILTLDLENKTVQV